MDNIQLFQKYRPKTLDEIYGHDKEKQDIKNRFFSNKFPQVVYISGTTGVGKTTFAMTISKLIQCENPIIDSNNNIYNPCNNCIYCNDINHEEYRYSTLLYNGSNLGVDDIRDIEKKVISIPIVSNNTVIIIDELQELYYNKKAQKSLLKVLETHLDDVYFILLSMDDSKVDKAIKSRGVRYFLKHLTFDKIADYLYKICLCEGIVLDELKSNVLLTISESVGGSVRDAVSILERVIYSDLWNEELIAIEFGIRTNSEVIDVVNKILKIDKSLYLVDMNENLYTRVRNVIDLLYKDMIGLNLNFYENSLVSSFRNTVNMSRLVEVIDLFYEIDFRFNNSYTDTVYNYFLFKLFSKQLLKGGVYLYENNKFGNREF